MIKPKHQGFTLIEVIIFIVVVGAGLAGILSVMNTVVKSSADPLVAKQTVAIAESMLEEILLKEFANPVGGDTGTSRTLFDDVDQYHGYNTPACTSGCTPAGCGVLDIQGTQVAALCRYNITGVTVLATTAAQNTALNAIGAKRVTVTVTGPQGAVTLIGYRSNY
nr:prepilin-type N-terminal cleavage/methylation domain-containing protein [Rhodoferax sp.]